MVAEEYIIRVQLVNRDTGKIHRSFDAEGRPWMDATHLYDRMQKIMDGKATKND